MDPMDNSEIGSQNVAENEQNFQIVNINTSQNLTMDGSYGIAYRSPCFGPQPGGTLSPSHGLSVREIEEQMDALKKENFNLKLRVYFLEEKLPAFEKVDTKEGHESLMKQFLDNKVETEILRTDLEEKRKLLQEAADAIEYLEDIQQRNEENNQHLLKKFEERIKFLQQENKSLKNSNNNSSLLNADLKTSNGGAEIETMDILQIQELQSTILISEEKVKDLTNVIKRFEEILSKKNQIIEGLTTKLHDLKMKNSLLNETVESQNKTLNTSEHQKLQSDLDKCRSEIADKICELDVAQEKYEKLHEEHEKALKYVEKLCKVTNIMRSEIDQLRKESDKENESHNPNESTKDLNSSKTNNIKFQNKIEVISSQLTSVTTELQYKNELIEKLKNDIEQAHNNADRAQKATKECSDVCNVLTVRLEELAGFLDSLLKHKEILNAIAPDKKREIQNAVSKSLDLSRSLTAECLSISNLSLNDTNLAQLSNITGILENTNVKKFYNSKYIDMHKSFEVKEKINDLKSKLESFREKESLVKNDNNKSKKRTGNSLALNTSDGSESEIFSEPDRNVSLSRIGLNNYSVLSKNRKSKDIDADETSGINSSMQSTDEKNKSKSKLFSKISQYEKIINENNNKILQSQLQLVEVDNRLKNQTMILTETINKLEDKNNEINKLELELTTVRNQLSDMNTLKKSEESLRQELTTKNEQFMLLQSEKEKLLSRTQQFEVMAAKFRSQTEELRQNYEESIQNIKENQYVQLDQINQEFKNKLNENIKEVELKHQTLLKENYIDRAEYQTLVEQNKSLEIELENANSIIEKLKDSEMKLTEQINNNEKQLQLLQKNLDENLLSLSKATLERTKFQNEKLNLETTIQELLNNCEKLRKENNILISQLNAFITKGKDYYRSQENIGQSSEENQRSDIKSPDLGIESDTGRDCIKDIKKEHEEHAEQEQNEGENQNLLTTICSKCKEHKCDEIEKENFKLRQKYKRLVQLYREILKKIHKTNENMEKFENNVKLQIQKTNEVLELARNNFSKKQNECNKKN